MRTMPTRIPGTRPAANRPPTEIWSWPPTMISGMLGGMIAPMTALAPVTAAEKALG